MNESKTILLADDSPRDVEMTLSALAEHKVTNRVVVVPNGEEVLDYLYMRGKFRHRAPGHPILVLLDLKMPRIDGLEALRVVKGDPSLKSIPVVMLTSSREEQDLVRSYELGANAYVVKPVDFAQFVEAVRLLGGFWTLCNEPAPGSAPRSE